MEEEDMCFSSEHDFYEAWRFEDCDDLMQAMHSGDIVFFNEKQSNILWSMFISPNERHMMKVGLKEVLKIDHYDVDFEDDKSASELFFDFEKVLPAISNVFVFFSAKCLCIAPYSLLKKYWNYFFLPSDETTVVVTESNSHFIFSYEERFFLVTR
ncbi:hypothetical protein [Rahnella selenatireducens]|uniref:hypothetical protein n=1 Tax=Rahnella selenatireducens TaxID=3389797 RepID=UPI003969596D